MYRASLNKYYVDDIYQLVFARGGVLVSEMLWWFDAKIIDGAVNGVGQGARWAGRGLRLLQTGRVQQYAILMFAVVAVAVVVFTAVH